MKARTVDHAQLMCTCMGDKNIPAVGGAGNAVRIGASEIDIVYQNRIDKLLSCDIDNSHRVGIDPAAFQLCRRKLITSQNMGNVSILTIR